MPNHRNSFCHNPATCFCAGWVLLAVLSHSLQAQSLPVVHLINNAGQHADTTLDTSTNFATSFKGSNDVVVTLLSGSVRPIYVDAFGGASPGNNPPYLTNYLGFTTNGTGDGIRGDLELLETPFSSTGCSLRFDFLSPLTPNDHILMADADFSEQYIVQAFFFDGLRYRTVSCQDWPYQSCSGQMGVLPDARWPIWNGASGTWNAVVSTNLNEPLGILTPTRSIDRVVFTKRPVGNGSAAIQFMAEPGSATGLRLFINKSETNVLLSWPGAFSRAQLYSATALTGGWSNVTNTPTLVAAAWVVTNGIADEAKFYRLQSN